MGCDPILIVACIAVLFTLPLLLIALSLFRVANSIRGFEVVTGDQEQDDGVCIAEDRPRRSLPKIGILK